jgi:hypothetical protein
MIINSRNDLKSYIDGDYGTNNPWPEVLSRAASMIVGMDDCPQYGKDWAKFLNKINYSELVIAADNEITNDKNRNGFYEVMNSFKSTF